MQIYLALILIFISLIYIYFKRSFNYWKSKKVAYLEPSFPLGNVNIEFFQNFGQELGKLYLKLKKTGQKYAGFYMATMPVFVPLDPELIKTILTKDFNHFNIRGIYVNEKREFLTAHLFAIGGPVWKKLRSKFTPTFSTSKLKMVMETMTLCATNMKTVLNKDKPFDVRDLSSRYTTDIICSCVFGIETNSLHNPEVEFRKYTKILLDTNLLHGMKLALAVTLPKFFKFLNVNFIRPDFSKFFVDTIKDIVEYREKNSIERKDLLDLLIKLKNNKTVDGEKILGNDDDTLTIEQLLAQCFVFFIAGFDTSSNTLAYCIFELAQNEDVQDKLRKEIYQQLKDNNGVLSYDIIMNMDYLDRVMSETLRKYPPVVLLNRECTEKYKVPDSDVIIEKGTSVFISLLGLHNDPEYFPDPEKFNPDRFSKEEKAKRHPAVYLPFGEGPKNCIGLRFGLLQTKIGIINMLTDYRYTIHPDTKLPIKFKTAAILLSHYGKIWLQAHEINKQEILI